jgi:hypothetical protein
MTLTPYDELCAWTLSQGDPEFVHQHVVDAHMLQTAGDDAKPIGIAFALAGLYLYLRRGLTGREVQLVHVKLGKAGGPWPTFEAPNERGSITPADVMAAPGGPERIAAIRDWCVSVWAPWSTQADDVLAFLRQYRIVP